MSHTFTDAEIGEIRMSYKQAKKPAEQIGILADLYACAKDDISRVLEIATTPKKAKRKSYDQAVRDQVVKAVLLDGETQQAVAERFGVPRTNVASWVQKAKAKQAEFMAYPSEPQAPAPVEAPTPTAAPDILERTAEELRRGAWGLRLFADSFAEADIYLCGVRPELGVLREVAEAYSAGFYAALKMAREAAK